MSRKYAAWFIFLCAVALLHSGASLLIIEVYKQMINSAIIGDLELLLRSLQLAVITMAIITLLGFVNTFGAGILHNKSTLFLQSFFIQRVLKIRLPQLSLFHSSDLVNRINDSTETAQAGINEKLIRILGDAAQVCFIVVYLLFIDWRITLGVALISTLMPALLSKASKKLRHIYDVQQLIRSERDSIIQNSVQGAEIVRALSIRNRIARIYADIYTKVIAYSKKALILEGVIRQGNYLIPFISLVFVLGYGGYLTVLGSLDIGSLVACIVAIDWIVAPLTGLANTWTDFQKAISNGARVLELEKLPVEDSVLGTESAKEVSDGSDYFKENYRIAFNAVSFSYTSEQEVLKGLELVIKSGTTIGIIGESGSGKSTFIKLILRLLEPSSGTITYNGQNMDGIPVEMWRQSIAYISQHTFLFTGTIRENIKVGKWDASEDEIMAAAKKANIHDVIMSKEEAYDTRINDNGFVMSGGERQRLSLARAFLRQPELIILDEPTASLDKANTMLIMESIRHLMEGKTTIIVTHDLTLLENADQIWRLADGYVYTNGSMNDIGLERSYESQI
ncbi:ABC transporter ATP-binding protein [Paenibacillus sp. YSY-4.3]